jgi:hypothetical protein
MILPLADVKRVVRSSRLDRAFKARCDAGQGRLLMSFRKTDKRCALTP